MNESISLAFEFERVFDECFSYCSVFAFVIYLFLLKLLYK